MILTVNIPITKWHYKRDLCCHNRNMSWSYVRTDHVSYSNSTHNTPTSCKVKNHFLQYTPGNLMSVYFLLEYQFSYHSCIVSITIMRWLWSGSLTLQHQSITCSYHKCLSKVNSYALRITFILSVKCTKDLKSRLHAAVILNMHIAVNTHAAHLLPHHQQLPSPHIHVP